MAALIAVVYRYVRDELDDRSPEVFEDGTRATLSGDADAAQVSSEQVASPAEEQSVAGDAVPRH